MSTPDQPSTPPLTRRQLRELRNTASTPIITPEQAQANAEMSDAAAEEAAEAAAAHEAEVAPERTPIALDDLADLDPDARPVTRRQARLLEKLRTGTVEVIPTDTGEVPTSKTEADAEPDVADAAPQADAEDEAPEDAADVVDAEDIEHLEEPAAADEPAVDEPADEAEAEPLHEAVDEDAHDVDDEEPAAHGDESTEHENLAEDERAQDDAPAEADADEPADDAAAEPAERKETEAHDEEQEPARVVAPDLGAQLLEDGAAHVELPPSFDHLLTRGGNGSASAPNALILSQTPDTGSLSVPILGTGELIITGSYQLPNTFGSTGAAPGVSDGKDADAALMDGELPPASSPTPIAASAAISTIKSADDIIRPPAPEKGSRLMMTLAICAGALGLAIATVLVLILVNGSF
ncbi:hypothetical protein [Microbacterium oleivorans]|uniref:Uncharacterized protein n=1 Tax=Microbacterium oleivorans TaxID=273677 RepID=A0A177KE84_9MICO|nr:hypothetical protein [Microbacterium oleivorans]OAH51702.1 hypothetical protein AYL44_05580 [Microbacterium oleivorans]